MLQVDSHTSPLVKMLIPYFVAPNVELSQGSSSSIKYDRLGHLLMYTATPRLSPAPCKLQIPQQVADIFCTTNTEASGAIMTKALACVERVHQYYVQKGSFSYRRANEPEKVVNYYADIPAAAVLAYRHPQLSLRLCHVVEENERLPSFPYLTNETFGLAGGAGQLRVRTLLGWKVERGVVPEEGVTMAWQVPGQSTEPYPVELLNAVGTDAIRNLNWALLDIIPDDAEFNYCGGCGVLRAEGAAMCCPNQPPAHSDHFTALLPLGRNWVISHEGRIQPYVVESPVHEPLAQHMASLNPANRKAFVARLVAQVDDASEVQFPRGGYSCTMHC